MATTDDGKVELQVAYQTKSRKGYYHLSSKCTLTRHELTSVGRVRVFPSEVCPTCRRARIGGQKSTAKRYGRGDK